ncbi:MAG: hypothetical protein KF819_07160 [Labilithrix sp.]|nr:hypothetical protein [Labilithrix sp.]
MRSCAVLALLLAACTKAQPLPSSLPAAPAAASVASVNPGLEAPLEKGLRVELRDDGTVDVDGVNASGDGVKKAFAKQPGDRALIHASANVEWGRVVFVLDQMKRAGDREFVFVVDGDPALRTKGITFPKAADVDSELGPRVLVTLSPDGSTHVNRTALTGSLRAHVKEASSHGESPVLVVVSADTRTAFARIVETVRDAQLEGARIALAVSP